MRKVLLSLAIAGLPIVGFAQGITQDFEGVTVPSLPTSWVNARTGAGNGWQTSATDVDLYPSSAGYYTIPASSKFAFVNDGGAPANYPATLTTPTFSISGLSSPFLAYDYNFYRAYLTSTSRGEQAWIGLSTDGGSTWTTVDTIRSTSGSWMTKYVSLSSYSSATNCKLRFTYTDNRVSSTDTSGILGVGIDNIKVFSPLANDLAFTAISPVAGDPAGDFQTVGGNITFGGTVFNNGASTVTSFNVTYKVGAAAPVTATVSGVSIAPFSSYTFTHSTPYAVPSIGTQNVTMYISYTGDTSRRNDTLTTAITGVSSFPHKVPLFEEMTGAWCGFCVRGIVYMDSLWELHKNDVSIIAVHNQNTSVGRLDGMQPENTTTKNYDAYCGTKASSFPTVIYDRYYTASVGANVFTAYGELITYYGFANMSMNVTTSGTTLNVSAGITPTTNLSGDYRLALVVSEDKVHGTTASFDQHNYYNGGGYGPLSGGGVNYVTAPATISHTNMYYNFVARYTVPDFMSSGNGISGSLPATMTSGTTYSYNFTPVTMGSTWVKGNLRFTIMLIDNNPSSYTYGMALNTISNVGTLAVSNPEAGVNHLSVYPNPATNNVNVTFDLAKASDVTTTVYDVMGRVVIAGAKKSLASGNQLANINVANLSNGMYTVVIATENGTITERFSIEK
ncbi:MAG: T9SS C-terminal target domain-containing protein [Chitinophagia bacterium]|nr:T9SS C-terminal target domain-containing protein [Chitinophagia bacterium]